MSSVDFLLIAEVNHSLAVGGYTFSMKNYAGRDSLEVTSRHVRSAADMWWNDEMERQGG